MTLKEELTLTENAISAILTGAQEYKTANTSVKKASLETLYKRRDRIKSEIDNESTGGVDYAVFDRR
jgi:hypothetical protein